MKVDKAESNQAIFKVLIIIYRLNILQTNVQWRKEENFLNKRLALPGKTSKGSHNDWWKLIKLKVI